MWLTKCKGYRLFIILSSIDGLFICLLNNKLYLIIFYALVFDVLVIFWESVHLIFNISTIFDISFSVWFCKYTAIDFSDAECEIVRFSMISALYTYGAPGIIYL